MSKRTRPTSADGTPHHWRCNCRDCQRHDEWVDARAEARAEAAAEERAYLAERAYERAWEGI